MAIRKDLLAEHPWLGPELMELFQEARRVAEAAGTTPPLPYGLERCRGSLQAVLEFAAQQRITERVYDVDDLFQTI